MRDSTLIASTNRKNTKHSWIWRQFTVSALFFSLLSGCGGVFGTTEDKPVGTIGYVAGFLGAVAADEPQAALIGRDVLSSGGSAADAAVAVGLAMSVTMPSAASLGGGGVCLVHDRATSKTQVLDFLPRTGASARQGADRPSAIPGNPRGFFVLHSRYGRLKWEQLAGPAENLARFGFQVSRAFASQLKDVAPALVRDPEAANVFVRKDGRVIGEGDVLIQPNLAAVLGRFRAVGVGDFYIGVNARRYVDAVNAAGGTLSEEDLKGYLPVWRQPIRVPYERNTYWQFAPPPAAAGVLEAQMMSLLIDGSRFEKGNPEEREHLLVEAAKRAFAERMRNMAADGSYRDGGTLNVDAFQDKYDDGMSSDKATPIGTLVDKVVDWSETPAAATLAVIDSTGSAVACALTMNNTFGTGRMVPNFGVMMAAAPDTRGRTYTPLGPVLLTSELRNTVFMAAAASGGVTAPTALINVAARATSGPQSVAEAIAAPRTHYGGSPDKVFVEAEMPDSVVDGLRRRGHDVARTTAIGRVNIVYCFTGVPAKDGVSCGYASDPRGFGIAVGGD